MYLSLDSRAHFAFESFTFALGSVEFCGVAFELGLLR